MSRWTRAMAAGALLLPLVGQACRGHEDPAARTSLEEATVTAEVRSRLLMADGLASLPLSVEMHGGTVTIKGGVADTMQPAAIRAIAERVRGVERVELDLRVVPPPDSTAPVSGAPRAARGEPAGVPGQASPTPSGGDTTRPARADSLPALDEAG